MPEIYIRDVRIMIRKTAHQYSIREMGDNSRDGQRDEGSMQQTISMIHSLDLSHS